MANVFDGIKVLDFTNNLAGPNASAMMADFGAEVIKIERPIYGDDARGISPRLEGQAIFCLWSNRGKKSVVLDMKDPQAVEIVKQIICDCDILIESFRPGQMKKFGLDYESVKKIKPDIIYVSISLAGQTGAYSMRPGFDIIAQGMSGFMDMTGEKTGAPTKCGATIGDYIGSFNAFGAMAAALYHREKTGEGNWIDIALFDGLAIVNSMFEGAANLGMKPTRLGNQHTLSAPYGVFTGNNGDALVIAAYTNNMWKKFTHNCLQRPELFDDPKFSTNAARIENLTELVGIIEEWLRSFAKIEDAEKILLDNGIAACKIRSTAEVVTDPVLWERGTIIKVPTPPSFKEHDEVVIRGPWIKMSNTPAVVTRAPDLGEHNYEVLSKYGYSKEQIDEMEQAWEQKAKAGR